MTRRVPVLATIVVLAAVATMIALGVWQLHRKEWKEALIARYERAQQMSSQVPWPRDASANEAALYRYSGFDCARVLDTSAIAGRSAQGRSGWAHEASCALVGGGEAQVALGWSDDLAAVSWQGGHVDGFVAPAKDGVRLIASPAQAGLEQLAAPDPRDIPNNHLAYAVQWFFFAATALAIYALALRKRWRER